MARSKIVDEGEVLRWFEEGRTYQWMHDEYLRKYNIETTPSMWGNYRRRKGLDRRFARNDDLIPWQVDAQHRWGYPITMLRAVARDRAGLEMSDDMRDRMEKWLARLEAEDVVVHYDPDTAEGWFYVPRRPGVDRDLIRVPERKTTSRRAAD